MSSYQEASAKMADDEGDYLVWRGAWDNGISVPYVFLTVSRQVMRVDENGVAKPYKLTSEDKSATDWQWEQEK